MYICAVFSLPRPKGRHKFEILQQFECYQLVSEFERAVDIITNMDA